jgi:hypothetical protein
MEKESQNMEMGEGQELLYSRQDDSLTVSEAYVRIRVHGGWMVTHAFTNPLGNSESSIFVPDADNKWLI